MITMSVLIIASTLAFAASSQAAVTQQTIPHPIYLPVVLGPAAQTATATTIVLPTPTNSPPATATPTATSIPTATSMPTQAIDYICSSNFYNCRDFATQHEAQQVFDYCMAQVGFDVHRLDGDNDGIACETRPVVEWDVPHLRRMAAFGGFQRRAK